MGKVEQSNPTQEWEEALASKGLSLTQENKKAKENHTGIRDQVSIKELKRVLASEIKRLESLPADLQAEIYQFLIAEIKRGVKFSELLANFNLMLAEKEKFVAMPAPPSDRIFTPKQGVAEQRLSAELSQQAIPERVKKFIAQMESGAQNSSRNTWVN